MKLNIGPRMGVRLAGKPCCETGAEFAKKPAFSEITSGKNVYYAIEVSIEGAYAFMAKLNHCPGCGEKIEFVRVKRVEA